MKFLKNIAILLALLIGVLSIFAGSRVLLEIDVKEYTVITWLVSYNVTFGFLSVLTAYLLWKNIQIGKKLIFFILTMHFLVFIYLKFISDIAAQESIKAMLFRTSIWILISLFVIIIPTYFHTTQPKKS